MPATQASLRAKTLIERTPRDAGWQMTLTVRAYDTGIIEITGGREPGSQRVIDPPDGWLGAAEYLLLQLHELQRYARREAAARHAGSDGTRP